jgi:hypothetical protein
MNAGQHQLHTIAVELDFMDPIGSDRRSADQLAELMVDELRHLRYGKFLSATLVMAWGSPGNRALLGGIIAQRSAAG